MTNDKKLICTENVLSSVGYVFSIRRATLKQYSKIIVSLEAVVRQWVHCVHKGTEMN